MIKRETVWDKLSYPKAVDFEEKYGTPLYLFNRSQLREQCGAMSKIMEKCAALNCYYMLKANWHPEIIREVAECGIGVNVTSPFELDLVKRSFPDCRIIAAGPAKPAAFLQQLVDSNVEMILVESLREIEYLNSYAGSRRKKVGVGCRCVLDIDPHSRNAPGKLKGTGSKFGWKVDEIIEILKVTSKSQHLDLLCLSTNLGSQVCNGKVYLEALDKMLGIVDKIKPDGINIRFLDLGGGFPIPGLQRKRPTRASKVLNTVFGIGAFDDYEHYAEQYSLQRLLPVLSEKCSSMGLKLMIEPGRWLVADSMALMTKVIDIRPKNNKRYIYVDAGIEILPDVGFGEKRNYMAITKVERALNYTSYCICGPLCIKSDILSDAASLPDNIEIGDYILAESVGAYCFSRTSIFSGYIPGIVEIENNLTDKEIFNRTGLQKFLRGSL
jgi:diaminopimelate decarboxylase